MGDWNSEWENDGRRTEWWESFFFRWKRWESFFRKERMGEFLWERWESTYTGNINQSKPRCFVLGFLIFFTPVVLVLWYYSGWGTEESPALMRSTGSGVMWGPVLPFCLFVSLPFFLFFLFSFFYLFSFLSFFPLLFLFVLFVLFSLHWAKMCVIDWR